MDFGDYFQNGFESSVNKLLRRGCVECPPERLQCPQCPQGQVCSQVLGSCKQCASRTCVPEGVSGLTSNSSPNPFDQSGGPNIGAIVGGVVGGVLFIAIATWLVWRFCIKTRRQQWEDEIEHEYEPYTEKGSSGGYMPSPNPNRAMSTQTRQSVASTAYTRGSNVIQIAFIPGITDRADEAAGFVPPVPPIPAASPGPQSPQSPYTDYSEDHYFMPGDLRDSTYSGFTDDGASTINRQSAAPSIAPSLLRQSVASNIYRSSTAENTAPAQTGVRGRPLMVSVKSSTNTSRSASVSVPAVPQIDYERFGQAGQATAAGPLSPPLSAAAVTTSQNKQALHSNSTVPVIKRESASDVDETKSVGSAQNELKSAIEEATRQASRQPVHGGLGSVRRDPSPFSDEHRIPSSDGSPVGS